MPHPGLLQTCIERARSTRPKLRSLEETKECCTENTAPPFADQPTEPLVVWEGQVQGDGTGPQKSYFVRLYSDGTAHCQCPAFYFRGTLRHERTFACKHVQRARLGMPSQG